MPTGTKDFLDDAVETLQDGGTPFALVMLDYASNTTSDEFLYSVRIGDRSASSYKDLRRLRQVVLNRLIPEIDKLLEESHG